MPFLLLMLNVCIIQLLNVGFTGSFFVSPLSIPHNAILQLFNAGVY